MLALLAIIPLHYFVKFLIATILACARDEEQPNPIWLVNALLSPNFFSISTNFCQVEVEFCRTSTKDLSILHTYLGWDTKKDVKSIINSTYGPVWISTNTIPCAWKLNKGSKLETMTIFQNIYGFCQRQLGTYYWFNK
jgi:hypothetical protein